MSEKRKRPSVKNPRAAEASLNDALSDLERILEKRHPSEGSTMRPSSDPPVGEQYDIPLLDDVVVPGGGLADAPPAGYEPPAVPPPGSPEFERACRLLVARIASEIEVIVQSRIEAALENATAEIRQQVKNHIEIMLPEILDEIIHGHRRDDN